MTTYKEYSINECITLPGGDEFVVTSINNTGGFGQIYFGYSKMRGVKIALKTLNEETWNDYELHKSWKNLEEPLLTGDFTKIKFLGLGDYLLASFFREARLVCQNDHPNLLRGLGFWCSEHGQPFLETQFIEGSRSVEEVVELIASGRSERLSWLQVIHYAINVCNGLIYASRELVHQENINNPGGKKVINFIHRDLKPGNMICSKKNNVSIIDFGCGRFQGAKRGSLTALQTSSVKIFTRPYAPIEQLMDNDDLGPSTDIYALGMSIYEMLGGDSRDVEQDHAARPYVPLTVIPDELNAIIEKCLNFDRFSRFQSFEELKESFGKVIELVREGKIELKEGRRCYQCGYVPFGIPAKRKIASGRPTPTMGLNGHEFKKIPAGSFFKGLRPEHAGKFANYIDISDEQYRQAETGPYYMSACTVSNQQYKAFVDATGHKPPENWESGEIPYSPDKANRPVTMISYFDAEAYCQWLGGRLPTGDEWEKAARGDKGYLYPWGDKFDPGICNTAEGGKGETVDVDSYSEADSPYGIRQMVGNVMEWVNEPHKKNPALMNLRGGTWFISGEILGAPCIHVAAVEKKANRLNSPNPPELFGFRVVLDKLPDASPRPVRKETREGSGDLLTCPICNCSDFLDFHPDDLKQPEKNPYTWFGYFDIW